jgi:hypothetical protein
MRYQTTDTMVARKACASFVQIFVPPEEFVETEEAGVAGEVALVWREQRLVAEKREIERAASRTAVHPSFTHT